MSLSNRESGCGVLVNCGCSLILVAFNIFIGAWSVNWLLLELAGKTIPLVWAMAIGLFAAEITVPIAIIGAILKHFGIL